MNNKKLVFIAVTLIFTLILSCCNAINKRKDYPPVHSALLGTWGIYNRGFAEIYFGTGAIRIAVGDDLRTLDADIIRITPVINTYTDTINYPSGFSLYCKITDKGLVIEDSENGNVARNINDDFTMTVFLSNDQKSIKIKDYNQGNPVLRDIIYNKKR